MQARLASLQAPVEPFPSADHTFEILAEHHDGRPVTGEDVLRMGKVVPQALQGLDRLFLLAAVT